MHKVDAHNPNRSDWFGGATASRSNPGFVSSTLLLWCGLGAALRAAFFFVFFDRCL